MRGHLPFSTAIFPGPLWTECVPFTDLNHEGVFHHVHR